MSRLQKSLFQAVSPSSEPRPPASLRLLITVCALGLFLPFRGQCQERFIRQIGNDYTDKKYFNALAVGVVKGDSANIYTFGQKRPDQPGQPTADSYFEIGTLTKVFTTAMFQDMVNQGQLDPKAPANHFLPDSIHLTSKGETPVQLRHLATHTAGLPRVDEEYFYERSRDIIRVSQNPYKNYTEAELYQFIDDVTPLAKPGEELRYSNVGMALLGNILERVTKVPYDSLTERYTEQMGLSRTKTHLASSIRERYLLPAYNRRQQKVPYWDFKAMAPIGALKSTPADMLRFLQISMGQLNTPMTPPVQQAQQVRDSGSLKQMKGIGVGYGWFQSSRTIRGEKITWHNGQSGGFSSFIAFLPEQEHGVVLLANTNGSLGKIAFQVLNVLNKK